MSDDYDYHLGYFEGVRAVLQAYHIYPELDDFYHWLTIELKEAKILRDASYED